MLRTNKIRETVKFVYKKGFVLYVRVRRLQVFISDTVNYPKKKYFFKEQNADFSAQMYRMTLKKPGLKKKAC